MDVGWERLFCLTAWCEVHSLLTQRYEDHYDLWYVQTDQHDFGWLIAAEVPICPCCGSHLLTTANIEDGVEGVTTH